MKKMLLAVLALGGLSLPVHAASNNPPPSYVVTATMTATNAAKLFVLQNTSADIDVLIRRVEVANVHNESAITGGMAQFWVYGSTAITHGTTTRVRTFSLSSTNASAPSYVSVSEIPTFSPYENLSGGTSHPLLPRPLYINTDETAVAPNLSDAYAEPEFDASPLILPKNSGRAIVVEQNKMADAVMNTGKIRISVVYTVR